MINLFANVIYELHDLYWQLFAAYIYMLITTALSRKKKKSAFCINWEIKHNWGSGWHYETLNGLSWGLGGQVFIKFTMFTLKIV